LNGLALVLLGFSETPPGCGNVHGELSKNKASAIEWRWEIN
jgi:hypothetical protein